MSRWKSMWVVMSIVGIVVMAITTGAPAYGETFSFGIIADPHIDGNSDHLAKFNAAVDWMIENKESKDIELVFVVGDIAWGTTSGQSNLEIAKAKLDELNEAGIPYIPIIGDNEVQAGCEEEFDDVFGDQYTYLSSILNNWSKAPTPVNGMYLQNFSFDYKYCHFTCADFVSRAPGDEGGELHDFTGGSWPWFKNDIRYCSKPKKENINIMTHIGMFRTGIGSADQYLFSSSEMSKIKNFIYGYRNYVDSNYAGHIHQNWTQDVWTFHGWWFYYLYTARVTDETWYDTRWPESNDQELTVRWVTVDNGGSKITYTQHIVDID